MLKTSIFAYFRRLTATVAIALLAACAGVPEASRSAGEGQPAAAPVAYRQVGFACCNLHYEGDQIKDSNHGQLPFVAAGTPIRIGRIDSHAVAVEIDGRPLRLVFENRAQKSIEQWMARIVVAEDPRLKLAGFPPAVRDAIKAGQLVKGMTREQAIMAVGYPQNSEKMRFDGPHWRYWWSGFTPYYVYWSGNKLTRIDGPAEVVAKVQYKGR